jgi:hypothetical protein
VGARRAESSASETGRPPDRAAESEVWLRPFPRLPGRLVATAGVLGLLSIALPNIAPSIEFLHAQGSPVRMFFGVSQEKNLPTFFSVMVTVAAASAQALVGRLVGGRVGTALYVTAILLLAMAFDDFVALHEQLDVVGEMLVPPHVTRYVWVIPGLLPGLVVLLAFWRLGKVLRGPVRRDLLLGVSLVLAAALGLETVNGFLDRPGTNGPPLQLVTHLEEFVETLGLIVVLRGSLAMLEVSRRSGLCLRVAEGWLSPTR